METGSVARIGGHVVRFAIIWHTQRLWRTRGKWRAMLLCSRRINGKEVRLAVLVQSDKQQAQALSCACQINKAAPLASVMFIKAVLARDEMPLRADGVYERLIADNDEGWRHFRRSTPQFSRC